MCKRWSSSVCLSILVGLGLTVVVQAKDPSLVAWWKLDETTGTTAHDSSGNGHDGTLQGGPQWVPGKLGGAIALDGVDDIIEMIGYTGVAGTQSRTVTAWIRTADLGDFISWGENTTSLKYIFRVQSNNGLPGTIRTEVSGGYIVGSTDVRDNEWHHAASVIIDDGSPDVTEVELYLDGEREAISASQATAINTAATRNVWIGDGHHNRHFPGEVDDVRIYERALTQEEIQEVMLGGGGPELATTPSPDDAKTDVPSDAVLRWTGGDFAMTHDVYLGTVLSDVNEASRGSPKGVLASQGQTATEFQPAEALEYGQTYYWRIDEVNAAPDNTIFKGEVWSFTVEPYGYPITNVTATASSGQVGMGPENTLNGVGLDAADQHSTNEKEMWLSEGMSGNWIQYEFDKVYKLYELKVWNSNQLIETFLGFGAKDVTIETSTDGATWTALADVPQFAQATGTPDYTANTTVNFDGAEAKFVKLTINSNWGGVAPQTGLSAVRFSFIPVRAREPMPADGAAQVSVDSDLNWRPGREATSHEILFGTDSAAVADGTVAAETVTEHRYVPAALDFGTTYYWKVNEIGAVTYPGEVWSFTTQEYAPIDDFESYTDQAGEEVFSAWIDGFTNGLSGSTVGYFTASGGTFGETTIIHAGKQSMPLQYDNTAAPFFSEAERTFAAAQDWTGNGADSLVVYFRGLAPAFAETASGSILMNAIGTDIWGTADQFRYAYRSLNGNGSMTARVDSLVNSNAWAKAGVMIRQNVQPGSVHAFMPITPGNSCSFQRRPTTGAASTSDNWTGTAVTAPYWVRITRTGNAFKAESSPDGSTWTALGTEQTIPMSDPVLIGLALTSHDAAVATSAQFSNVSTTGNVTGTWQVAEIGATQPEGNSVEGLYLAVTDSSGKSKVVQHADAAATAYMTWQAWTIPLSEFTSAGVKMTAVKSLTIGVGNKAAPKAGGTGTVYLDDIGFGHPAN